VDAPGRAGEPVERATDAEPAAEAGQDPVVEPAMVPSIAASTPRSPRRRPPPGRVSPQALADARGGAVEGLVWLGRIPESRASILYRVVRVLAKLVLRFGFRFHMATSGREHLPAGGYLLVAAAHRGWMDPILILDALPVEPRVWFLGSAPSTFTSWWRERFVHRLGGLLPVWRGGVNVGPHIASARAVIANGGVFAQMPEGTVSGPAGRIGPFRVGWALIALRTGAPIVPFAIAGTEELYIGRRMASRILPPTTPAVLLGPTWDGTLPPEGSRAELALARELTERLEGVLRPVVEEIYPGTVDPPSRPRRLRRRLTWLLLRPGRLDRDDAAAPREGST
jgi:1-acyl-sn-glycerol-3-phosphate acyltransferase